MAGRFGRKNPKRTMSDSTDPNRAQNSSTVADCSPGASSGRPVDEGPATWRSAATPQQKAAPFGAGSAATPLDLPHPLKTFLLARVDFSSENPRDSSTSNPSTVDDDFRELLLCYVSRWEAAGVTLIGCGVEAGESAWG